MRPDEAFPWSPERAEEARPGGKTSIGLNSPRLGIRLDPTSSPRTSRGSARVDLCSARAGRNSRSCSRGKRHLEVPTVDSSPSRHMRRRPRDPFSSCSSPSRPLRSSVSPHRHAEPGPLRAPFKVDASLGFNQTEYRGAYATAPPGCPPRHMSPSPPKKVIPWSKTEYQASYLNRLDECHSDRILSPPESRSVSKLYVEEAARLEPINRHEKTGLVSPGTRREGSCGTPMPPPPAFLRPITCGSEEVAAAPRLRTNWYCQAPLPAEPQFFIEQSAPLGILRAH